MFKLFKEKLKSWFSSTEEKIKQETQNEQAESEEMLQKADKLIEKAKKQKTKPIPQKFNVGLLKTEPDLQKIKEKEIRKMDRLIQKTKNETHQETPLEFHIGKKQYQPDTQKIVQEAEKIKQEIDHAKKLQKEIKEVNKKVLKKPEQEPQKKGFLSRIISSLAYKITKEEFENIFDDLELLLLENNVALEVVEKLKEKLSESLIGKEIKKGLLEATIKEELKTALNELIIEPDNPLEIISFAQKPFVILFFGVNGTGKTTSIAKVAYFLKHAGHSVVLAAGDTFRAASIEQLAEHAKNLGVPIIKHDYNADPAAVGFDAIKYAKAHKIDIVLIDTAGRMHTKKNLIEEMKKIERITHPNLKLLIAESIAGNDAIEQAKTFHQAITIDGTILSKADIDEKGGTIISVSHATKKPIFYLGTGQHYQDLQLFNKQKFIESLGL